LNKYRKLLNFEIENKIYFDSILNIRCFLRNTNYGIESVWQSYNAGNSWTNISGNLPDMPIRWAIYNPNNKNNIMLATETGIWTTNNANESNVTWIVQNSGLANVRIDMLDIRKTDNLVLAGTHGRTMYTTVWETPTKINNTTVQNRNKFSVFPNPAKNSIYLLLDNIQKNNTAYVYDITANMIKRFSTSNNKIDISNLEKGVYFIKIDNETIKFIKD